MNIFEDLIEELKEENLLEETVIDVQRKNDKNKNLTSKFEKPEVSQNLNQEMFGKIEQVSENPPAILEPQPPPILSSIETIQIDESQIEENLNQPEFFKKRATEEVTSLQMVEHVLSGVERDFLHITPKLYDDLEVKKALHTFLQVSQNINSPEQAHAEFLLMQETESWYSALSQKDKNINVGYLRCYCETTHPALSLQALAALARFYRNAPFSESVRSKFDLVMTRFFARETGGDFRRLLLSRDEIIEKLNEFYAEWSSIPLYATDEDESGILLAAIKFEEFTTEADEAENFEVLIKNDFFNRLKVFKEETHENFFAPLVTATTIESNVRIGNRFLQLLLNEKENAKAENFEEKYGNLNNQIISEVVGKTIQIANVFEEKFADVDVIWETPAETAQPVNQLDFEKQNLNRQTVKSAQTKTKTESKSSLFRVNKWLLAATILAVVCSVGLYLYVEYFNPTPELSENVKTVNLENSSLSEHIQTARLNGDMFYGIVNPNWDVLHNDKKEELLRKVILVGGEKGFVRVTLMNRQGRTVGYASPEKTEIYNP
ncbi:hypothetical protein BH20ACI4_BH20ACI4_11160 [soil metagenome]